MTGAACQLIITPCACHRLWWKSWNLGCRCHHLVIRETMAVFHHRNLYKNRRMHRHNHLLLLPYITVQMAAKKCTVSRKLIRLWTPSCRAISVILKVCTRAILCVKLIDLSISKRSWKHIQVAMSRCRTSYRLLRMQGSRLKSVLLNIKAKFCIVLIKSSSLLG